MRDKQVTITAGTCKLTLNLPIFFEDTTLTKIRKALSLLTVDPWDNRETVDVLGPYLEEWMEELQGSITSAKAIEQAYQKSVSGLQSQIACFGSMATPEMKKQLLEEQRQHKAAAQRVKSCQATFTKANKIKLHFQAVI